MNEHNILETSFNLQWKITCKELEKVLRREKNTEGFCELFLLRSSHLGEIIRQLDHTFLYSVLLLPEHGHTFDEGLSK